MIIPHRVMHACARTHTHIHTELYQCQYLSFDIEDVNIGGGWVKDAEDQSIHFFANSCESIIMSKLEVLKSV